MLTLMQLDVESGGSVDPDLAASICGYDRALILELITLNEQDEINWRQSRDQALRNRDAEGAEVCELEMQAAARSVKVLRQALMIVVQGQRASGRGQIEDH